MMNDDEVLWNFDPHTLAKHQILRAYLSAWAPIMLQGYERKILYVDGFAGPGESKDRKHPGSPIIALDLIAKHRSLPKFKGEVVMHFIEIEPKRAEHLNALIKLQFFSLPQAIKYDVLPEDFSVVMKRILKIVHDAGHKLAPAFCFVDPFGWKDIDTDLLSDLMLEDKAELFITFMAGFVERFIMDEQTSADFSKLFSDQQISQIKAAPDNQERERRMLEFLVQNLKAAIIAKGKTKEIYHISFEAIGKNNNLIYYLIYFTSHLRGLEVMKEAMFAVGKDGSYSFSDFDFNPGQKKIVNYDKRNVWTSEAADDLYRDLKGKTLRVREIKDYTTINTKWVFRKEILKKLEEQRKISCQGQRRKKFTYPDDEELIDFANT